MSIAGRDLLAAALDHLPSPPDLRSSLAGRGYLGALLPGAENLAIAPLAVHVAASEAPPKDGLRSDAAAKGRIVEGLFLPGSSCRRRSSCPPAADMWTPA